MWIVDWIDRAGDLYVWGGLSTCMGQGSHRGSKTW